jgi:hypothetical protein
MNSAAWSVLWFALLGLLALSATTGVGAVCIFTGKDGFLEGADVALLGRVVAVERLSKSTSHSLVTLRVQRLWKGATPAEVKVLVEGNFEGSPAFEKSQEYFIALTHISTVTAKKHNLPPTTLVAGLCSQVRVDDDLGLILQEQLGNGRHAAK